MERIGVDPAGIRLMIPKQFHHNLKLEGLTPVQANIIKQDMLSLGGEAAVSRGAASCSVAATGCILSGTVKQLRRLAEKLGLQPYGLAEAAGEINSSLESLGSSRLVFKGRTREWDLSRRTLIMGVLNVTPDSFSDGGRFFEKEKAIGRAIEMLGEGADIIDIGGESTRPGSAGVSPEEEKRRVIPVVEGLVGKGAVVSVDTTKADVAEEALKLGAEVINDVSAMTRDARMAGVVRIYSCGVILMHSRGTPETMQEMTHYGDLMAEIFDCLSERLDYAIASGIGPEKTVIDPGIGFAKSAADNLEIIRRLSEFKTLGRPVCLGVSRKSFVRAVTGGRVGERLNATLAAASIGVLNGARIVRVHDVREAKEAVSMADAIMDTGFSFAAPEGI
ncbi:MAG: dihydropteroate synthase [Deltaproteobacteria bacterium]|nr:dihydropteroate synthase [Deltaproteobacteria bacterium]